MHLAKNGAEIARAGMTWEAVGRGGRRLAPTVAINTTSGIFGFTTAAYEAMGKPDCVMAVFNREHASIGFVPCEASNPQAFWLNCKGKAVGGGPLNVHVRSIQLARKVEALGYQGAFRLPVQWHPDGILWADLTLSTRLRGRPKKSKGPAGL